MIGCRLWLGLAAAIATLGMGLGACASARGHATGAAGAAMRAPCPVSQYFRQGACVLRGDGAALLVAGTAALQRFGVDEALDLLHRARERGPHGYAELVQIYEQLGIAYAYLGKEEQALDAFGMLLSLDAGHLLSYTLSPKATFVFERARALAGTRPRPAIDLSWPHDLEVSQPVPIDIEVVADPRAFLRRAELYVRRRGEAKFLAVDIDLPEPGTYRRVLLGARPAGRAEILELYLIGFDEQGNQVLRWSDAERPREIALGYRPPVIWYRRWWVWAVIGGAVAAATGATVYALSREPPALIGGHVEVP